MFEAALLSIIIVLFRGGLSKKSEFLLIKGWYLFIIGIFIQRLPDLAGLLRLGYLSQTLESNFVYVHSISYLFILITLILNIKLHSIKIILAGTILNILAIFSNNGYMPVSRQAIESFKPLDTADGLTKLDYKHVLLDQNTNFPFLTDIISTPKWYPLKNILSIGDIFIAIGIFILIQKMFVRMAATANQEVL